jgi:hypothetical protein
MIAASWRLASIPDKNNQNNFVRLHNMNWEKIDRDGTKKSSGVLATGTDNSKNYVSR